MEYYTPPRPNSYGEKRVQVCLVSIQGRTGEKMTEEENDEKIPHRDEKIS